MAKDDVAPGKTSASKPRKTKKKSNDPTPSASSSSVGDGLLLGILPVGLCRACGARSFLWGDAVLTVFGESRETYKLLTCFLA